MKKKQRGRSLARGWRSCGFFVEWRRRRAEKDLVRLLARFSKKVKESFLLFNCFSFSSQHHDVMRFLSTRSCEMASVRNGEEGRHCFLVLFSCAVIDLLQPRAANSGIFNHESRSRQAQSERDETAKTRSDRSPVEVHGWVKAHEVLWQKRRSRLCVNWHHLFFHFHFLSLFFWQNSGREFSYFLIGEQWDGRSKESFTLKGGASWWESGDGKKTGITHPI